MPANPYSRAFYDAIREGCQRSAEATLDILGYDEPLLLIDVVDVVDVGGGEGWWARHLEGRGAFVEVWDGGDADDGYRSDRFSRRVVDLAQSLPDDAVFDLALCLEVAEHLPPERGPSFVADLCRLADTVVFSAAMPRQGGTGHINCQPPAYWASLFRDQGFGWKDPRLDLWDHPDIEPWYKTNLLVFVRQGSPSDRMPPHLIHPDLWLSPH